MHILQVLVDFSFDRGKLGQTSWEISKTAVPYRESARLTVLFFFSRAQSGRWFLGIDTASHSKVFPQCCVLSATVSFYTLHIVMVRLFELFGCAPSPTKTYHNPGGDCDWAGEQRKVYMSLLWNFIPPAQSHPQIHSIFMQIKCPHVEIYIPSFAGCSGGGPECGGCHDLTDCTSAAKRKKHHACFAIAQVLSGFPQQKFQVPKMEVLNLIRLFGGWVLPHISLTYSLYRWGFLNFRSCLECLVTSFPPIIIGSVKNGVYLQ